jgi:hypothetical protein
MNRLLVPLLTSAGLLGGFGVARATGVRAAGGGVLGAVGAAVFALVARRSGALRATVVVLAYLGAFGGSHPLAKRLGAWPSVFAVAAATALPAALLAERRTR